MKKNLVILKLKIMLLTITAGLSVFAQHPNHKFPHISVQQCWVKEWQLSTLEILAKGDLIQADLTTEQIGKLRILNPNAVILPFYDIGGWDEQIVDAQGNIEVSWRLPKEWAAVVLNNNPSKQWWVADVTSNCPIYHGPIGQDGVSCDGKNYQQWKAEAAVKWGKENGFDGTYLDCWTDAHWGPTDRYTVEEYRVAMSQIAKRIRDLWPEGIFVVNSAGPLEFSYDLNGHMWEDWSGAVEEILPDCENWTIKGEKPTFIILNTRTELGDRVLKDKNNSVPDFWETGRYNLAISMLKDNIYTMYNYGSGGSPHWASNWWFDEYDVDIDQPSGNAYKLSNGVWVREFTNGLVLMNSTGSPKTVNATDLGNTTYYRFQGGQQPNFNNGSQFTSVLLESWMYRDMWPIGDGIILVKSPQIVVADIVIDDENPESEPFIPNNIRCSFAQTGMQYDLENGAETWPDSWHVLPNNSCYFASSGNGSSTANWTPNIGVGGKYEVFEWHPASANHASKAPYVIKHANGENRIEVDQTKNGGQWNSLGIYDFTIGTSGYVQLSNKANGMVIADAIKLVYQGSNPRSDYIPPDPPKGLKVEKPWGF